MKKYFGLVKFSHTIFAMPFAMVGFFYGVRGGEFSWLTLLWVLVCMVSARNAAMGFNRFIDRRFDAQNPRTAGREIPSGVISEGAAAAFVILNIVVFVASSALINKLCLVLSPVALAVVLGYSLTKRFTALCHIVLGLGLSIAPMAAYIAVRGEFSSEMLLACGLVMTWVAGFDIIFALQDVDFDRSVNLNSIPARLGVRGGLIVSGVLHLLSVCFVVVVGVYMVHGLLYWIGATLFIGLLTFQHLIVRPSDLSRVNLAFGTTNGVASLIFGVFTILAMFI